MARRTATATDLGLDLDRFAAPKSVGPVGVLVGVRPWARAEHDAVAEGVMICPGCADHPPGRWCCLVCGRFAVPAELLPGDPIDSRPDPDYRAEPTAYVPDPKLKGGRGVA